jgi:hypothetical protein
MQVQSIGRRPSSEIFTIHRRKHDPEKLQTFAGEIVRCIERVIIFEMLQAFSDRITSICCPILGARQWQRNYTKAKKEPCLTGRAVKEATMHCPENP